MVRERKVFIETSVLLAASIKTKDWKTTNTKRSERLLEFLRQNVNKRLGITTETVEEEAKDTLEKAVMKELEERSTGAINREIIFERSRIVLNECEENLREYIAILLREPIISHIVNQIKKEVDSFYRGLKYRGDSTTQIIIRGGNEKLKKIQQSTIRGDSILRLQQTYASDKDRRILSEAIYIKRNYDENFTETDIYFASNDQHFSPLQGHHRDFKLTRRIEDMFSIKCDWPERILTQIKKT